MFIAGNTNLKTGWQYNIYVLKYIILKESEHEL